MMHLQDFVVSIREAGGGKAFREFKIDDAPDTESGRNRKIHIPFDQEYEFVFKNMSLIRRSVEISIDGTEVGTWVINGGSRRIPYEVILERFMDSNKKFKVLRLDDPGVGDPTDSQNGIISVKVIDEKKPSWKMLHNNPNRVMRWRNRNGEILRGSSGPVFSCSTADLSINEPNAATGEGSESNQTFKSTTWLGDSENIMTFVFCIVGVEREPSNIIKPKYCEECGFKLGNNANFCGGCGLAIVA